MELARGCRHLNRKARVMKGLPSYIALVFLLLIVAITFGIVGPRLVSTRSDEGVLLGFGLVIFFPIMAVAIWRLWRRSKEGKDLSRRTLRGAKKLFPALLIAVALGACSKVPAGNVGVIVNLYGSDKGVSEKEVGVGRYWVGWNEELYLFPTFTQNDTWQRTKDTDQSITFQTGKDGMTLNADLGITFRVDPGKVTKLFQTYRKGVEEISDIYLRNFVRDSLNEVSADMNADEAYGRRKNELLDTVEKTVRDAVSDKGIIVEKVYLVGDIRLPEAVRSSLNAKNAAFQQTLQREQEVAKAKAEADIKIAEARGTSESTLINARAQADANRILAASLSPELVRYRAIDKWDGSLPRLTGGSSGAIPFIDVTAEAKR